MPRHGRTFVPLFDQAHLGQALAVALELRVELRGQVLVAGEVHRPEVLLDVLLNDRKFNPAIIRPRQAEAPGAGAEKLPQYV